MNGSIERRQVPGLGRANSQDYMVEAGLSDNMRNYPNRTTWNSHQKKNLEELKQQQNTNTSSLLRTTSLDTIPSYQDVNISDSNRQLGVEPSSTSFLAKYMPTYHIVSSSGSLKDLPIHPSTQILQAQTNPATISWINGEGHGIHGESEQVGSYNSLISQGSHSSDTNLISDTKPNRGEMLNSAPHHHRDDFIRSKPAIKQESPDIPVQILEEDFLKLRNEIANRNIKFIIYPDDGFRVMWDTTIVINLIYTMTIVPYVVAFVNGIGPLSLRILEFISEGLFLTDIIFNFFLAYFDKKGNLVLSKKRIGVRYLKSWFIPDLIMSFPYQLLLNYGVYHTIDLQTRAETSRQVKISSGIRLILLIRVFKYFRERNKALKNVREWFAQRPGADKFVFSVFTITMMCHIMTCIWYILVTLDPDPYSWISALQDSDGIEPNPNNFDIYVASFYWVLETITGAGYGDIHATTTTERFISIIVMLVGCFIYSLAVGSISSILTKHDAKQNAYENKLVRLFLLKRKYPIDNDLFNKVKRALAKNLKRDDQSSRQFIEELPPRLRLQISTIIYKNIVKNIDFFKDKPPKFLATIGPMLNEYKVQENDYIFTEGSIAEDMYFIKKGTVSFILNEYDDSSFMTIEKGGLFGDVALLFDTRRKYSCVAKTECKLLSLQVQDLNRIFFKDFPEIGSELYSMSLKKRSEMRQAYTLAVVNYKRRKIEKKNMTEMHKVKHEILKKLGLKHRSPIKNYKPIIRSKKGSKRAESTSSSDISSSSGNVTTSSSGRTTPSCNIANLSNGIITDTKQDIPKKHQSLAAPKSFENSVRRQKGRTKSKKPLSQPSSMASIEELADEEESKEMESNQVGEEALANVARRSLSDHAQEEESHKDKNNSEEFRNNKAPFIWTNNAEHPDIKTPTSAFTPIKFKDPIIQSSSQENPQNKDSDVNDKIQVINGQIDQLFQLFQQLSSQKTPPPLKRRKSKRDIMLTVLNNLANTNS